MAGTLKSDYVFRWRNLKTTIFWRNWEIEKFVRTMSKKFFPDFSKRLTSTRSKKHFRENLFLKKLFFQNLLLEVDFDFNRTKKARFLRNWLPRLHKNILGVFLKSFPRKFFSEFEKKFGLSTILFVWEDDYIWETLFGKFFQIKGFFWIKSPIYFRVVFSKLNFTCWLEYDGTKVSKKAKLEIFSDLNRKTLSWSFMNCFLQVQRNTRRNIFRGKHYGKRFFQTSTEIVFVGILKTDFEMFTVTSCW